MSSHFKKIRIKNFLSTLLLLVHSHLVYADENPIANKQRSLAIAIADAYIPSFYTAAQAEREAIIRETAKEHPAHEVRPPRLDVATHRRVIFNKILAKSNQLASRQEHMEPMLNEYAWTDLKLFYGTSSEPGYHLMSRINKTPLL